MIEINNNSKKLNLQGGLYELYQKSIKLENEGKDIIHMEIGKPDFDSPEVAKEATIKALNDGFVHYTEMNGIVELRKAITKKYNKEYGISYNYDNEIVVTAGACEALLAIFLSVLNKEDEIIVPSPFFSAYKEQLTISGNRMVEVPLKIENDFSIKAEDIEKYINKNTKALLINSPHNPTGAIVEEEDLKNIADLAKKYDLIVISDETYDKFIFEGSHYSISKIEGMKERTLIVNSTSKTFSMTGWRIGYVMGPKKIISYINKIHQNCSTCATSFAQKGAVEAFEKGGEFTKKMVEEFKRRRDLVYNSLSKIEGIKLKKPKGAFYSFFNIEDLGITDKEFCDYILDEVGVVLVPGSSFGEFGKGFVRLSYTCSYKEVGEALLRIEKAVKKL